FTLAGNYINPRTKKFAPRPELVSYTSGSEIAFNNTAEKTLSASVRYAVPLAPEIARELVVNADHYWSDELMYGDSRLDSYHLTNFRISLKNIATTGWDARSEEHTSELQSR